MKTPHRFAPTPARSRATVCLALLFAMAAIPLPATAQFEDLMKPVAKPTLDPTIGVFGPGDERKTEAQRREIEQLARRRLGLNVGDDTATDLDAIQRLIDGGWVRSDDVATQQALGVLLGDALDRDHRTLRWAVVDDKYGHSRALRYRETKQLFFPITMISKRIKAGERIDAQALYDLVANQVVELETEREATRRRTHGRR